MKILDYSPIPFDGGKLPLQERLKGIFQFGFSWVSEMKSQEVVVETFTRILDKRFTLLRNVPLPDGTVIVPLILLGPQGILVMYNSPLRGIFQAAGDSWEIMDNRLRNFKTTRPNLITRTLQITNAFDTFLKQKGLEIETYGILIFTDPGIHVNTNRSDVRVILMDAIERLGSQMLQAEQIMSVEDIRTIINTIAVTLQPEEDPKDEDRFVPHQQVVQTVDSGFMQAIAPLQKKLNFKRRQWILLGAFIFVDILILIGFLIFILWTA